jgi:hypothetical protein
LYVGRIRSSVYTMGAHTSVENNMTPTRAPLTPDMKKVVDRECDAGRVNARLNLVCIGEEFPDANLPALSSVQGYIGRYLQAVLHEEDSLGALSGSIRHMGFDQLDLSEGHEDRGKAFCFTREFELTDVGNDTDRDLSEPEMQDMRDASTWESCRGESGRCQEDAVLFPKKSTMSTFAHQGLTGSLLVWSSVIL